MRMRRIREDDPSLGRFAQADTIVPGGVQAWNRYAYVNNAPTRFTDPSGYREVEWTEGGGGFPLGGTSDDGLNLGCGNSFTVTNMAMTPMLLNGELSYLQITKGWFSNWLSKYALQSVYDVNIVCSGGYCTDGVPPSMVADMAGETGAGAVSQPDYYVTPNG